MQLAAGGLPIRRRRKYCIIIPTMSITVVEMGHVNVLFDELGLDEMG